MNVEVRTAQQEQIKVCKQIRQVVQLMLEKKHIPAVCSHHLMDE